MTNRELAALAVKLLGVYCLILFASAAPNIAHWLAWEDESVLPRVLGIASMMLFALLGVTLVWKSDWFVGLVLPAPDKAKQESARLRGLQEVLFSVVGVVLVVHALPNLASRFAYHAQPQVWEKETSWLERAWPELAGPAVEIVLGVALFLGSAGLARIWRRIQEMNRAP